MNEKNYFTIVVPLSPDAQKIVQGNPSAVPLRAAVWSQAAERMKPLLGGVCSRFSPAAAPYGEPLHLPFGVALGGAEAEQFLLCYFHARENQEEEIRSRTQAIRALGRKVGQFHPDEETTLTVMAFRSSDPELHKQMDVAQRFFSDDITAAAGLYYLALAPTTSMSSRSGRSSPIRRLMLSVWLSFSQWRKQRDEESVRPWRTP